ncbi:MAG: B12-binding domain-containing radical SAM protein, partial [Acetobacteraceae bacterium]|nr:B12-binding domain-containing radical SAM protein [Acetobacteraceae bacterium]
SLVLGMGALYGALREVSTSVPRPQSPLSGRRNRARSPENTVAEIMECVERFGIRTFFFSDDCFTVDSKRCMRLCSLLSGLSVRINWSCEGRVDTVNPELLRLMRDAGCFGIQFGVESGSDHILKSIRKGISRSQVMQAVKWAVDVGLRAVCSFQVGHPEDTEETIRETISFAAALRRESRDPSLVVTDFAVATPLPGTVLRRDAARLGLRIHTSDWDQYTFIDPVMDTRHLTADQISSYVAAVTTRARDKKGGEQAEHSGSDC